jgi:hypothetical protein
MLITPPPYSQCPSNHISSVMLTLSASRGLEGYLFQDVWVDMLTKAELITAFMQHHHLPLSTLQHPEQHCHKAHLNFFQVSQLVQAQRLCQLQPHKSLQQPTLRQVTHQLYQAKCYPFLQQHCLVCPFHLLPNQLRHQTKRIMSYGGTPPANVFPLQLCEGDCDVDSDVSATLIDVDHLCSSSSHSVSKLCFQCEVGLVCFQRIGGVPVPGCVGGTQDRSNTDYCISLTPPSLAAAPTLHPTQSRQSPSESPSATPPVPNPTHMPAPQETPSTNPRTIKPSTFATPVTAPNSAPNGTIPRKIVSYGGTPPANAFPLQLCEGDCDVDSDVSEHKYVFEFVRFCLLMDLFHIFNFSVMKGLCVFREMAESQSLGA